MAEQQGLLLAVERCQDGAQGSRPGDACQHGVDIALVVEQAGNTCPQLRQHFRVDARRPLIDYQQRDVVLSQLPGNNPEGRLMR